MSKERAEKIARAIEDLIFAVIRNEESSNIGYYVAKEESRYALTNIIDEALNEEDLREEEGE